jgi:DNA-binding NtrC family response regulator
MPHKILLVDDDESVRFGLARVMLEQPFEILTARTATDAMSFLKRYKIDLIVSDERMPGMSGIDLLTWVADNDPDVIRIVLTGQATLPSALRAINDARVHRFLLKPCDPVQLALTIRKALEERDQQQHPQAAQAT